MRRQCHTLVEREARGDREDPRRQARSAFAVEAGERREHAQEGFLFSINDRSWRSNMRERSANTGRSYCSTRRR
jgi:hypothetical protein